MIAYPGGRTFFFSAITDNTRSAIRCGLWLKRIIEVTMEDANIFYEEETGGETARPAAAEIIERGVRTAQVSARVEICRMGAG